jgi:hypothetical protein
MTLSEFKNTFAQSKPMENWKPLLRALWFDGKGDWESAHDIAQDIHTVDGSWIHAYLHRKEGDDGNASYWYHRAGKTMPQVSLEKEWEQLADHFLQQ